MAEGAVNSLRARQFAAIAVAIVAAVGVTLILAVLLVRSSAKHEALKSLARQAALIAAQHEQRRPQQLDEPRRLLRHAAGAARDPLDPAGRAAPPARRRGASSAPGEPAQGSLTVGGHALPLRRPPRRQARGRAAPARRSSKPPTCEPFTIAFAIAAAVGAAIAAVVAFLLARAVARPIERVSEASLALAAGDRPGPLPVTGSTEVAALAASFNRLADDLDRARAAERSFLLSVSHELKTPLAAIRGHGEALLDGVMTIDAGRAGVSSRSRSGSSGSSATSSTSPA